MIDYRLKELQKRFGILGESEKIYEVIEIIDQVATTDITVLITGESGTGKELIADAIYKHSLRKHQKFIKVNCGAIPAGILESELFGHVKGSFTGAIENRKGYFETANGGTIFLDEIGEMPMETQVKFLRVLESGEFIPVGGSKGIKVDVRIVAATNKNLEKEITKDKFRKDLYYRLKTITVIAPALRKHAEDIPELVKRFALVFSNRNAIPFKGFSPNAMNLMMHQSWPGNIRELKNFVESMIVLQKGEVITSEKVRKQLGHDENDVSPNLPMKISKPSDQAERELILQQILMLRRDIKELKDAVYEGNIRGFAPVERENVALQPYDYSVDKQKDFFKQNIMNKQVVNNEEFVELPHDDEIININKIGQVSMEDVERILIEKTLKKFGYKKRKTANALKISERTLYRKIKEYDLQV